MNVTPNHPEWLRKLPNRLTYFRIFCIPLIVYLLTFEQNTDTKLYFWQTVPQTVTATDLIAALIFALAALTDLLDGWIARRYHIETMLGKLLDPLADKLLIVSALIILVEKHRMAGWVAVILIVRDLGINAVRIAAMDDGIHIPSSFLGKMKTTLLDVGIIGLIIYSPLFSVPFHLFGHTFVYLALTTSVISGGQYLWFYYKELNSKV